jgi:hypothetical protein
MLWSSCSKQYYDVTCINTNMVTISSFFVELLSGFIKGSKIWSKSRRQKPYMLGKEKLQEEQRTETDRVQDAPHSKRNIPVTVSMSAFLPAPQEENICDLL